MAKKIKSSSWKKIVAVVFIFRLNYKNPTSVEILTEPARRAVIQQCSAGLLVQEIIQTAALMTCFFLQIVQTLDPGS